MNLRNQRDESLDRERDLIKILDIHSMNVKKEVAKSKDKENLAEIYGSHPLKKKTHKKHVS